MTGSIAADSHRRGRAGNPDMLDIQKKYKR